MRRVPWASGRRALVRQVEQGEESTPWMECIGEVRCSCCVPCDDDGARPDHRYWRVLEREFDIYSDHEAECTQTFHLPDQCRTCHGFRCWCPGEGWEVPVHVRLPPLDAAASLRSCAHPSAELLYPWNDAGVWMAGSGMPLDERLVWNKRVVGRQAGPGTPCPACVPYINGRPVWVDPWEG